MIQAASSQPHELCDLWVALTGDRFEFGRHRGNTFDERSHFQGRFEKEGVTWKIGYEHSQVTVRQCHPHAFYIQL
jgi:hypothetical protein